MGLHPDAHNISAKLKKEGATALYHFTSVENLPLISKHQALCSKEVLESKGNWPVPQPGGNERSHALDREKGNWGFVSLNFTPHTPMAYGKKKVLHLCFLEISTDVALREGVIFTDSNATYHAHDRGERLSGLQLVNFEMVRSDPRPWDRVWFEKSQAEVLVPHSIGLESIHRVCFVSNASLKEGMRLWGDNSRPQFVVDRVPFADSPKSPDNIDFSHISELFLLDSEVTEKTIWQNPQSKERFKKGSSDAITALVEAKALAGTNVRVKWNPVGPEQETELSQTNKWRWAPKIPMSTLPTGHCNIEIWLGDIRWLTTNFELVD